MDQENVPFGLEWCRPITNRPAKEEIAAMVAARAERGQTIGAGSGSTSFLTVLALGERNRREDLGLLVVPSSIEIQLACDALGLPTVTAVPDAIEWCFDGADEVDPDNRLIKGRGGAIYRERLVFGAARRRLVVADESKTVDRLGSRFPVPVEVEPLWCRRVHDALLAWPNVSAVRLRLAERKDGPVITEQGGLILDVTFSEIRPDENERLTATPGVRCTGIFSGFEFERLVA